MSSGAPQGPPSAEVVTPGPVSSWPATARPTLATVSARTVSDPFAVRRRPRVRGLGPRHRRDWRQRRTPRSPGRGRDAGDRARRRGQDLPRAPDGDRHALAEGTQDALVALGQAGLAEAENNYLRREDGGHLGQGAQTGPPRRGSRRAIELIDERGDAVREYHVERERRQQVVECPMGAGSVEVQAGRGQPSAQPTGFRHPPTRCHALEGLLGLVGATSYLRRGQAGPKPTLHRRHKSILCPSQAGVFSPNI
jgi:hypothetical protein